MSVKGPGEGSKPEGGPMPNNPENKKSERDLSKLNYYDILGVSRTATPDEIQAAFRSLTLKLHPDRKPVQEKFGGSPEYSWITQAYSNLIDENLRRKYDSRLDYEKSSRSSSSPRSSETSGRPHGGSTDPDFNFDDFLRRDFEARKAEIKSQKAKDSQTSDKKTSKNDGGKGREHKLFFCMYLYRTA